VIVDDDPGLPGPLEPGDRLRMLVGASRYETDLAHWLPEHPYNEGFRRAAEILGDHISRFPEDIADLTMPLMYCYRHSVELRLKHLWTVAAWLETGAAEPLEGHDLCTLWHKVKPVLSRRVPTHRRDLSELATADIIVREIAELDPRGEGFRYPEKLKKFGGGPTLPPDVRINLENVGKIMPKLLEFLDDAAADIVDELLERGSPRM
jgi:hypothetical protein